VKRKIFIFDWKGELDKINILFVMSLFFMSTFKMTQRVKNKLLKYKEVFFLWGWENRE